EAIIAANEYANQQGWLERHDKGVLVAEGVFVASLGVAQRQDGSLFTFATWTEDVDSLLPRADFVGFSSLSQDVFLVLWQAVEREVDLVPVDGLGPVRFRVHAWPPPPVVERLRAEAVNP